MKLGVISSLRSVREVVDIAVRAERAGFWGLGVADTAPLLFQAAYPTITVALMATERIHIGSQIGNPVSQHWSVHASSARTMEELAPGRSFVALATGDGAVHSVGLRPSSWRALEEAVTLLKPAAPPDVDVFIAASGPRGSEAAGRVATDVEFGVGLDVGTLRRFADRARATRAAAGIDAPLGIWAMAPVFVVDDEADLAQARLEAAAVANATARFCFDRTFEDKGVPAEWQDVMRERLRAYDFGQHGTVGQGAANGLLFADRPDIQEYLIDRMLLIGTREQIGERIERLGREAGLDGLWMFMIPSSHEEDRVRLVDRVAEAVAPVLA